MGIFSGGFGTGLATGLATSVSKSLTDAMDRREEELSKARVFWQTRQAQKQDQVDAENKRIEKAYTRLTSEMGGDAAKGLAAYQAVGGNIDDVERYIDVLNKTQEASMDYTLQDRLDFDGLSLGDYGDFTYDKGFDSIKSVVTAADVNYVEAPSLLTAIGLGQDTDRVGKSLGQQVDQLIPRSERTDAGIGAATVKGSLYEGMATADEQRRVKEAENRAIEAHNLALERGEYDMRPKDIEGMYVDARLKLENMQEGTDEYNQQERVVDELSELLRKPEEKPKNIEAMYVDALGKLQDMQKGTDEYNQQEVLVGSLLKQVRGASEGKASAPLLISGFKNMENSLAKEYGFDGNTIYYDDNMLTGQQAQSKWQELRLEAAKDYVQRNVKFDADGFPQYAPNGNIAAFLNTTPLAQQALESLVEERQSEIGKGTGTGTGEGPPKVTAMTLEQAQEEIANLDISSMTPEAKEAKKADIIFNATRGAATPAEFGAVRAQLEEIFVDTGLSVPEEPEEPKVLSEEKRLIAEQKANIKEIEEDPVKYLVNRINATGTLITEEDLSRITKVFYNRNERTNPSLYSDYGNEMAATEELNNALENPAVIEALQNAWDKLPVSEKDKEANVVAYARRGVDTGKYGTFKYSKSKMNQNQ